MQEFKILQLKPCGSGLFSLPLMCSIGCGLNPLVNVFFYLSTDLFSLNSLVRSSVFKEVIDQWLRTLTFEKKSKSSDLSELKSYGLGQVTLSLTCPKGCSIIVSAFFSFWLMTYFPKTG